MSPGESRVVAAARSWIGTPYCHQASLRGVGCDCLGLVRGIWREVVGPEPVAVPAYSPAWGEARGEEVLLDATRKLLAPSMGEDVSAGDILVFRMRTGAIAKHLGIVTEGGVAPRFVHAYSGRAVIECALESYWRRRIVARLVFPGV